MIVCSPTGDCHQSAGLHLIDVNTELNDDELGMFELPNDVEHSRHDTQTTQDVNMSLVNTREFLIKQEQKETKFLLNKQSAWWTQNRL